MKQRQKRKHLESEETLESAEQGAGMRWAPCLGRKGCCQPGPSLGRWDGGARVPGEVSEDAAMSVPQHPCGVRWHGRATCPRQVVSQPCPSEDFCLGAARGWSSVTRSRPGSCLPRLRGDGFLSPVFSLILFVPSSSGVTGWG